MPLVESIQSSSSGRNNVQLDVSYLGNDVVRVAAGDFRIEGSDYTLSEYQDYTISAKAGKSWLVGYLAIDNSVPEVVVLVDHYEDPVNEMYKFDDGAYSRLWLLFAATLPPGVTDLNVGASLQVLKIVGEG